MKTRIVGAALVAGGALLASGLFDADLLGYVLNGPKWATSQVSYYINPQNSYLSDAAAISAIMTGAAGWHDQTRANIQLVYAGQTNGSSLGLNYKNEVFFRNTSSGYWGETYWWYDSSNHIIDFDTVFYNNAPIYTGSGCSAPGIYLENLAIHELGHGLGLGHSSVAGATMSGYLPSYCDQTQLTLEADDIAAIETLYPGGGGSSTPTALAAPSQLTVTPTSSSPTSSLTLNWNDNANNEDGYGVEWTAAGGSFAPATQLGANTRTYVATGLAAGVTYYFRVYAYNSASRSGYSNEAGAQTQTGGGGGAPTAEPAAPSQLTVTPTSSSPTSSLTLNWIDNADNEDGYGVEGTPAGASFAAVTQLGANTRTYVATGLAAGVTYYFRLYAYNSAGHSGYSNEAGAQTQVTTYTNGNTAPNVTIGSPVNNSSYPQGAAITFSGAASDTQDGVLSSSLRWTSSRDGSIGSGASFTKTLSVGTHTITATVTDNGGLSGSAGITVTVTSTSSPAPPISSGPTLSARGYKEKGIHTVDLSWSGFSGGSVDVYRNGVFITTTANDGSHTDSLGERGPGESWSYRACAAGTSTCSNTATVSF
jgi:matrixin/fibronectin type III domain protein